MISCRCGVVAPFRWIGGLHCRGGVLGAEVWPSERELLSQSYPASFWDVESSDSCTRI